jgi:hypothetical protein
VRQKLLPFDHRIFAACRQGEIDTCMDRFGLAAGGSGEEF